MNKQINLRNKFHYFVSYLKSVLIKYDTKKVDFLIAGTQKGGTTALHYYLSKHPSIIFARTKEVHFFDFEPIFFSCLKDFAVYRAFFPIRTEDKLLGEATPIYMWWKNSIESICTYNRHMKIIVILRNPIDRAYSHWNMETDRGNENMSFKNSLLKEIEMNKDKKHFQDRVVSYISRGMYYKQIVNLYKIFNKNNILLLKNEDLRKNPNLVLNEIFKFLDIKKCKNIKNKTIHKRIYKEKISLNDRRFLIDLFESDIKKLEKFLNWDCSSWYEL